MEEEQVLKLIQENMAGLQQKNQGLENKIAEVQLENRRMKVEAQGAATRIKKNKEVWKSLCDGVTELLGDMSATKVKLSEDGVALEYFTNEVLEISWRELWKLGDKDSANRENTTQVKEEVLQVTPGQPFNGIGREEKMEITFSEGVIVRLSA